MSISFTLKAQAVKKLIKQVDQNFKAAEKLKKEYQVAVSAVVYRDIIEHFEKEQGPKKRWKEWSDAYTKHMTRRKKGANFILQDTGRLRNNFKKTSVRKTQGGLMWFNDARTKKGFPYAAAHNYGLPNEQGNKLPERRFMWLSDKAHEEISEVTAAFYLRGV